VVSLNRWPLLPPFGPPDADAERSTVAFPLTGEPRALCRLLLPALNADLSVAFNPDNLPVLQNWRDPRPYHRVLAMEPQTSERAASAGAGRTPRLLCRDDGRSKELTG